MRLQRYLNEFNVLGCYLLFDNQLNEMSDETFNAIKKMGEKVGLKIHKSNTIFQLLKRAGKGVEDLIRYASLYATIDVRDKESQKELKDEMRKVLKHVNKKELTDFFLQLDKNLLGLTSIPRHILSSLFGVHISTYHTWKEDKEYIVDSLRKVLDVLTKMEKDTGKSLKDEKESIKNIQKNISEL